MSIDRRRDAKPDKPKKKCQGECGKDKSTTFFYKVDSHLFPDGMLNTCRDCLKKSVDVTDMESVIGFLRQIDKPFLKNYWDQAVKSGKSPLGEYIRKINSLHQASSKSFDNSDGIADRSKIDLSSAVSSDSILTIKGEVIEYSDELVDKWGIGYNKPEYLQMELYFRNMTITHEINTSLHIDNLKQLSYLSVERNRMRQTGDWNNYTKVSKTIEEMSKSSGFRPVDRQGLDDATGLKSFSQIFEEVEKKGFRKPPPLEFKEDEVDAMLISLFNYYHRIVGAKILEELPEEVKREMDEFYEVDMTPVEMEDGEYEELDFTVDDDEEDVEIEFIKEELEEIRKEEEEAKKEEEKDKLEEDDSDDE